MSMRGTCPGGSALSRTPAARRAGRSSSSAWATRSAVTASLRRAGSAPPAPRAFPASGGDGSGVTPRCVVDTMLGRLGRWLRAMGYDTLYPGPTPGEAGDQRLLQLARAEDRILVTRDRMLARLAEPRGCLIRSELVDDQLLETVERLGLVHDDSNWL